MLQTLKLNSKKQKKSSFYKEKSLIGLNPGVNPTNFDFFIFLVFAIKLGHLNVKTIFSYVINNHVNNEK